MKKEYENSGRQLLVLDTSVLINNREELLKRKNEFTYIVGSVQCDELDNQKESTLPSRKFIGRKGLRTIDALEKNEEVNLIFDINDTVENLPQDYDKNNNDNKILSLCQRHNAKIATRDRGMLVKANALGIDYISMDEKEEEYKGYIEIEPTDERLAKFYENPNENIFNLLINEYVIIGKDIRKWNGETHVPVEYNTFKTDALGNIKPFKNMPSQVMAMDSLKNNKLTMLKGKAGSGKSYLALGYLFSLMEKGKIGKIIIFTQTVPTIGAAKIGYLPGTREEKLLESSIGNFLTSKIGGKMFVRKLIEEDRIVLLPLSDIRGFDTTSSVSNAVYITEAQNMDINLLKLSLQRLGENTTCIVDGDYNAQVDDNRFSGDNNGMRRMSKIFRGNEDYGEVCLDEIVRSGIAKLADKM